MNIIGILLLSTILSQHPLIPAEPRVSPPQVLTLEPLKSVQPEVEDAIAHLSTYPIEDRDYIKYLSYYAVPKELREDFILSTSFALHSLVGATVDADHNNAGSYYPIAIKKDNKFIPVQRVGSNETLYWIDIRDYNWTLDAWEKVAVLDGYFVEPIVQHPTNSALRLMGGNAIVRGDWFLRHSLDTTRQQDNQIQDIIYYNLLYAQTGIPKNSDEYRKIWGLDIAKSQKLGNEYAVITENLTHTVNRSSQRALFYYRTESGFLYESFDYLNNRGKRNIVESFFRQQKVGGRPDFRDAGELFGTNTVQMIHYLLVNDKDAVVNFGDPTAVRHLGDMVNDARVRTPHSCIDCHAAGPLPSENVIKDFIEDGASYYLYDKKDYNRVKRTLLSERFEESLEDSQAIFARALLKVNGCTPSENIKAYTQSVRWYDQPVGLEQAAFECGVTVEEFKGKILEKENRFGSSLKRLCKSGVPIPRDFWESPSVDGIPGGFQQAMIYMNGLTLITEEYKDKGVEYKWYDVIRNVNVYSGKYIIGKIPAGQKVILTGKTDGRYSQIKFKNGYGWILTNEIRTH